MIFDAHVLDVLVLSQVIVAAAVWWALDCSLDLLDIVLSAGMHRVSQLLGEDLDWVHAEKLLSDNLDLLPRVPGKLRELGVRL